MTKTNRVPYLDTATLTFPMDASHPDTHFSEAPPAYSIEPSCSEQRLELTPYQGRRRALVTSSITKRFDKLTLMLHEQEDGVQIPSYGRNDVIDGTFCFDNPTNISSVAITIHGEVETMATEFGAEKKRLLHDRHTLWKNDDTRHGSCPSQIPFSSVLPSIFVEDNEEKSLPPSFHIFIPGFCVKIYYCIFIEITRFRRSKFDFSSPVKRYSVPFKYLPRTRPNQPIVLTPGFLSSVKTVPEEWHQASSTLETRPNAASQEPLHCHFFVPSVRIFGLKDTIPFHIQLSGPISSLREFFPPDVLRRITSSDSSLSAPLIRPESAGKQLSQARHCVRVQLLRQVVINNEGRKVWGNSTIGQATVYPLPPPLARDQCLGMGEESLDWEGQIKCNEDATVGSFGVGFVQAQHFLSLTLTPPDLRTSPFRILNINVPVRIVSDSYSEFG